MLAQNLNPSKFGRSSTVVALWNQTDYWIYPSASSAPSAAQPNIITSYTFKDVGHSHISSAKGASKADRPSWWGAEHDVHQPKLFNKDPCQGTP